MTEKTVQLIQQLSNIQDTLKIEYPTTSFRIDDNFQVFFNMKDLETSDFHNFTVYSASELMNCISALESPKIEFSEGSGNDKYMIIESNTDVYNAKIKYLLSNENIIDDLHYSTTVNLEDYTDPIVAFPLSSNELSSLKAAAGVLYDKYDLVFEIDQNNIHIRVSKNAKIKDYTDFEISIRTDSTDSTNQDKQTFVMILDFIHKLPSDDYNVEIYNDKIIFRSEDSGYFTFVISVNKLG